MLKLIRSLLPLLALAGSLAMAADELAGLKKTLAEKIPGVKPDSIAKTPITDLYEVVFGTRIFYVTKDGRFAVEGDILDLKHSKNLSEVKRSEQRLKIIKSVPQANMIVYSPKQVKHTLTVFTDIDCGFCRKMHRQMTALHQHGIKIRYMFYPQTGIDTPSYQKAVAVWCAKDRSAALTSAKSGESLKTASCDHPIKKHMDLAHELGILGTPMLLLEDGAILEGFSSVEELIQALEPTQTSAPAKS